MRSLFLVFYFSIMGCLVLVTLVTEYIQSDSYAKEVEEDYLGYAQLVTRLITPALIDKESRLARLQEYKEELQSDELKDVIMISLAESPLASQAFVEDIRITQQTDYISVVVPLPQKDFANEALKFEFQDSYSDNYMDYYLGGNIIIFLFMGGVIGLLTWFIYRYMNRLSAVSREVADGQFQLTMPSSSIPAVQSLSMDINKMAKALDERATENAILSAAIHHELRIPITRIRLVLDMVLNQFQKTQQHSELHEMLQDMDGDIEEFIKLTEALLTLSRLSLTGDKVPSQKLSVQSVMADVINRVDSEKITWRESSDFILNANQTLLERALENIIQNASKYANQQIHISLQTDEKNNKIIIEDDGPGISKNERQLILKPFYRIDKSRNRNTGGFGLGLAITNMVVRHTSGQLYISKSALGGARIELSWPP